MPRLSGRSIFLGNNPRRFNHQSTTLNHTFLRHTAKFNVRQNVFGFPRDGERERKGEGAQERKKRLVVGLAFNRRRDVPFLRPSRGWARAPVLESTLTDLANYRAGSSAYLPWLWLTFHVVLLPTQQKRKRDRGRPTVGRRPYIIVLCMFRVISRLWKFNVFSFAISSVWLVSQWNDTLSFCYIFSIFH